jgi:subtilisin family serine protease
MGSRIGLWSFGVMVLLNCYGLFALATPFNGYIVKLKPSVGNLSHTNHLKPFGKVKELIKTSFGEFAHLLPAKELSAASLAELKHQSNVEYVEPNYIIKVDLKKSGLKLFTLPLPTDDLFYKQWALVNDGKDQSEDYSAVQGEDLNILKAWEVTKGNSQTPVKVGVVDTGVDYLHPDLAAQMNVNLTEQAGKPGVDDDNNGYVDDIYGYDFAYNDSDPMDGGGHGTHCAGVIGANHDGQGIVGVAAHVKIVALKFLTDEGEGQEINAVRAIDYAINNGIKVLSNSWGGSDQFKPLEEAVMAAQAAGIVFVAAAGNDNADNDTTVSVPANYQMDNVISVGSFDSGGNKSSFSNFGLKTVHVMAPGSDILSTFNRGNYEILSGTSMAAPHVAGVAALILSRWPNLSPLQVRTHLLMTTSKTSALSQSSVSGGRVDAHRALSEVPE